MVVHYHFPFQFFISESKFEPSVLVQLTQKGLSTQQWVHLVWLQASHSLVQPVPWKDRLMPLQQDLVKHVYCTRAYDRLHDGHL